MAIVQIGEEKVSPPSDVAREIRKAKEEGRIRMVLLVDHQGDLRDVALRVD